MKEQLKQVLADAYLDFFSNFLTRERYAEYHGITIEQANQLIALGRSIREDMVKELQQ